MKRLVLILASTCASLMACDETNHGDARADAAAASVPAANIATATPSAQPAAIATTPPPPANSNADNTAMNATDAGGGLTAGDQGGSEADRKLTQQIRQAVMADSSLSMMAKNIKIITLNGKVTLKGPVKSDQERAALEVAAKRIAGVSQVDNQLEIKK